MSCKCQSVTHITFDELIVILFRNLPPHENVVQTFGLTNDSFNLMLLMEYCNGGSLDVKLFDLPEPVSDKEKLAILIGIAQGMQHLHRNKIIHRDLAARNILLNSGVPKVSVSNVTGELLLSLSRYNMTL